MCDKRHIFYICDLDLLTGFSFIILYPVQTTKWLFWGSKKANKKTLNNFCTIISGMNEKSGITKSHRCLWHIKIFTLHQGRLTENNITIDRNAILWLFDFSSLTRHQRGMTGLLHLIEDKSIKSAKSLELARSGYLRHHWSSLHAHSNALNDLKYCWGEKKTKNRVTLQMADIPAFGKVEEKEYWKAELGEVKA